MKTPAWDALVADHNSGFQDQWQRKKQTKEEARKAKRAKLDPENVKSAKDVMDQKALKRKREEDGDFQGDRTELEQPREGMRAAGKMQKKLKRAEQAQGIVDAVPERSIQAPDLTAQRNTKITKREENMERIKSHKAAMEAKREVENPWKQEGPVVFTEASYPEDGAIDRLSPVATDVVEFDPIEVDGLLAEECRPPLATDSLSSQLESSAFDLSTGQSGTSSISSIVPPLSDEGAKQLPEVTAKLKINPAELKARLQKRIEDLRAARKADGLNGSPARNRQELMEARRRKEEQRRAHKKELRQMVKMEEQSKREEALASRNSPALSWDARPLLKGSPRLESRLSFGRVAFDDGEHMDATLSTVLDPRKRRGPQDPLTAIKAVERKQQRITGLDEAKRADIEEKEVWLNARKHAHGERVRDDTSLLKKTLKRKEKAKQKSEQEWRERLEGVEKVKATRQKKRDDNLKKRRD